jgi:GMP synthase (glutamine-hydrolysing)
MRIQAFQHVAFEDIGSMRQDLLKAGFRLSTTHWYLGDKAPILDSFDALVVMGGPMGVYDEQEYPWLAEEKGLINSAIDAGKIVLGICLGAQLIACARGAKVTRNPQKEIGWFPLTLQPYLEHNPIAQALNSIDVFHWHGDTFALPAGATWLASSDACQHQAFSLGDNVFAFQFHLETTRDSASALIDNCAEELDGSLYVQDAEAILHSEERFAQINRVMSEILRVIFKF